MFSFLNRWYFYSIGKPHLSQAEEESLRHIVQPSASFCSLVHIKYIIGSKNKNKSKSPREHNYPHRNTIAALHPLLPIFFSRIPTNSYERLLPWCADVMTSPLTYSNCLCAKTPGCVRLQRLGKFKCVGEHHKNNVSGQETGSASLKYRNKILPGQKIDFIFSDLNCRIKEEPLVLLWYLHLKVHFIDESNDVAIVS